MLVWIRWTISQKHNVYVKASLNLFPFGWILRVFSNAYLLYALHFDFLYFVFVNAVLINACVKSLSTKFRNTTNLSIEHSCEDIFIENYYPCQINIHIRGTRKNLVETILKILSALALSDRLFKNLFSSCWNASTLFSNVAGLHL